MESWGIYCEGKVSSCYPYILCIIIEFNALVIYIAFMRIDHMEHIIISNMACTNNFCPVNPNPIFFTKSTHARLKSKNIREELEELKTYAHNRGVE